MKKESIKSEYSGIRVTDSISLFLPRKKSVLNIVIVMLIALCGIIGTVFSFTSMFDIAAGHWHELFLFAFAFYALFCVIFLLPGKWKLAVVPVLILYEVRLLKSWDDFVYGFTLVFNQAYSVIKHKDKAYFSVREQEISETDAQLLFLVMVIFIICAIVCYATVFRPNFLLGFAVTFSVLETGLYNGKAPRYVFAFMVVIYLVCLIVLSYSGYFQRTRKKTAGFYRNGNVFTAKPGVKFAAAGASSAAVLAVSALIALSSVILLDLTGYKRSDSLNETRRELKAAASDFSFDDLSDSLQRISAAVGVGNFRDYSRRLGNMGKVSFSSRNELTVITDKGFENNIYLKGYVGSVYDGRSWDVFDNSRYREYDGLFTGMKDTGEFPQNALFGSISDNLYPDNLSRMEVIAEHRGESFNFVPYNSMPIGKTTYINDTIIELESKRRYSFDVSLDQDYTSIFMDLNVGISAAELEYTDFVYENYLDIPDTPEMKKIYDDVASGMVSIDSIDGKLTAIKAYLNDNTAYTLEPGRTPEGKDFVNYFLTTSKKGYCMHYATSGVVLARMLGIPARYTEGYVISAGDFSDENRRSDGSYKINIPDSRAHAWAEIYMPGWGWIPYEFTPPSAAALSMAAAQEQVTRPTSESENPNESSDSRVSSAVSSSERDTTAVSSTSAPILTEKPQNGIFKSSDSRRIPITVIITAVLVIAAGLAAAFIVLKRKAVLLLRKRNFENKNRAKAAVSVYNYIIKLLGFGGFSAENAQYMKFAAMAEKETGLFSKGEFSSMTREALGAGFGGEEPDEKMLLYMVMTSERVAKQVYDRQSPIGKFKMKYINNLC